MAEHLSQAEKHDKLIELIKDMYIAMMTTVALDGELHSRPMATAEVKPGADAFWFIADRREGKLDEIRRDPRVGLSYANPEKNIWVSVSGTATPVDDRAKIKELWSPMWKAWFPDGQDDPNIILIRVEATTAEYWDSDVNRLVALFGAAKAAVTGEEFKPGENETVQL